VTSLWRGATRPTAGQLLVSEIFGPTVQGEGPAVGRAAAFLRLGGCNLSCGWCDTPYTWDAARHDLSRELTLRDTGEVAEEVLAIGAPLCVITGGEPMLQAGALRPLVLRLKRRGLDVHIETNGTVAPGDLAGVVDLFVVSPKTANSGVDMRARRRTGVLAEFAQMPAAMFKFVVADPLDLVEVCDMVMSLGLRAPRVWIMPEGTTAERVTDRSRSLAPLVAARGFNLGTRLHVMLWDDTRGR